MGIRQILNYGHTFAHAIEINSNFKISHGHAVAIGMKIMVKYFYGDFFDEFVKVLEKYGLDYDIDFDTDEIIKICKLDKKSRADKINIVIVKEIGTCEILKIDFNYLRKIYENR